MQTKAMGEVLELVRDPIEIEPATKYRKIGVRSFGNGIFHYDPMPGDQLGKLRFFRVRPDELVLSNIKAWEGAVAVSSAADDGTLASNRFLTYRPADPNEVDVRYLKYFFLSDAGNALIQRASPGSADRNRTLGIKAFETIEIPLPEIDEQRAISAKLESVEAKSGAALATLDTATDLYGKLVSSLVHRPDLSDAEKTRRGWRHLGLDEVLPLDIDAVSVEDDRTYPMVGVYSFGRGLFEKDPVLGQDTSYKKYHRLRAGQIVLSRLFAWEGAIALVGPEHTGRFASTEFPTFGVNETLAIPEFLEAHLGTETFWGRLRSEAAGVGVRRQRVSADRFLAQELWLPPADVQAATVDHLVRLRQMEQDGSRREMLKALVPSAINATFADLG